MTEREQAKLLDFGLAKQAEGRARVDTEQVTANLPEELTHAGTLLGTVAYTELARGKELDARTDLFSFGTVLYEMAASTLPFRGDSSAELFDAILNREPVSHVRLNPEVPPKLEELIAKAMEKGRTLRHQSAAELRTDLQRLRRDTASGRLTSRSAGAAPSGMGGAVSTAAPVVASAPSRRGFGSARPWAWPWRWEPGSGSPGRAGAASPRRELPKRPRRLRSRSCPSWT